MTFRMMYYLNLNFMQTRLSTVTLKSKWSNLGNSPLLLTDLCDKNSTISHPLKFRDVLG